MNDLENRLNEIWKLAPELEISGQNKKALTLWWEAIELKLKLGATGAGDIGELADLRERIGQLEAKVRSSK